MTINTSVEARISFGQSYGMGRDGMHATIEVTDLASRSSLISIQLTPEDVGHLLGGQSVKKPVELLGGTYYAERVGRIMEHKVIEVPETFKRMPRSHKHGMDTEPSEAMVEWAISHMVANGWQEYHWSYHNYGWQLTMRRWVEGTEEQMDALLGRWI